MVSCDWSSDVCSSDLFDSNPWIFAQLLQAQGNTIAFAIVLQNLYINLVANVDDFGRMLDALPRHVGDVQQAVNATQIDECAVTQKALVLPLV